MTSARLRSRAQSGNSSGAYGTGSALPVWDPGVPGCVVCAPDCGFVVGAAVVAAVVPDVVWEKASVDASTVNATTKTRTGAAEAQVRFKSAAPRRWQCRF